MLTNLIQSPPDARDYQFQSSLPASVINAIRRVDLIDEMYSIDDQLSEGSCVENALPGSLESVSMRRGTPEDLSRQFPYFAVRDLENRLGQDGTWIRDALEVGRKVGFCLEQEWPYDPAMQDVRPSQLAYDSAKTRRIGRYESVPLDPDNMMQSIANIKAAIIEARAGLCSPPIFAMNLGQKYRELKGLLATHNYISYDSGLPGTEYIGIHAQEFRGFDDDLNLGSWSIKNSWGTSWGDGGYGAIPYTLVVDMLEVWIVRSYKGIDMSDQVLAANRRSVTQLYAALFGRAPERDGLAYWAGQLLSNPLQLVAQSMFDCDPARAYYPAGASNTKIIWQFYLNVLGRQADADGLAYWVAQLDSGKTPGAAIADMINAVSAYAGDDPAALASQRLFANKVAVGLYCGVDLACNNVNLAQVAFAQLTDDPATVELAMAAIRVHIGSGML